MNHYNELKKIKNFWVTTINKEQVFPFIDFYIEKNIGDIEKMFGSISQDTGFYNKQNASLCNEEIMNLYLTDEYTRINKNSKRIICNYTNDYDTSDDDTLFLYDLLFLCHNFNKFDNLKPIDLHEFLFREINSNIELNDYQKLISSSIFMLSYCRNVIHSLKPQQIFIDTIENKLPFLIIAGEEGIPVKLLNENKKIYDNPYSKIVDSFNVMLDDKHPELDISINNAVKLLSNRPILTAFFIYEGNIKNTISNIIQLHSEFGNSIQYIILNKKNKSIAKRLTNIQVSEIFMNCDIKFSELDIQGLYSFFIEDNCKYIKNNLAFLIEEIFKTSNDIIMGHTKYISNSISNNDFDVFSNLRNNNINSKLFRTSLILENKLDFYSNEYGNAKNLLLICNSAVTISTVQIYIFGIISRKKSKYSFNDIVEEAKEIDSYLTLLEKINHKYYEKYSNEIIKEYILKYDFIKFYENESLYNQFLFISESALFEHIGILNIQTPGKLIWKLRTV